MRESIKKHLVLIGAFLIPILFIMVVAVATYLPPQFLSTDYDFVYITCDEARYDYNDHNNCAEYVAMRYTLENGVLQNNEWVDERTDVTTYQARIFLHNTDSNVSEEITYEVAQRLILDDLLTSPDGVTISNHYDRGDDFFLFFDSGSEYGYYLTRGNVRQKLNLINLDQRYYYRYQDQFSFIGWVRPN